MTNPFKRGIGFLKEVRSELVKVSWASREELLGSTGVVIAFTSLLAVFIAIVDLVLTKGLSILFR